MLNTEALIRALGFGPLPAFEALLAEAAESEAPVVIGLVLYSFSYSTWTGRRGLYIDDLFVREAWRGQGAGELLLRAAARVAIERRCARLDLQVLHWNPARRFYEKAGLQHLADWLPYRIDGAALERLAGKAPTAEAPGTASRPDRD